MEPAKRADLQRRLELHAADRGYTGLTFLGAGGSAAVFRVFTDALEARAVKVFDPDFLEGAPGEAERRRLDLQAELIGHSCPTLVTTFDVSEAHGTAFVEMEHIEWPPLTATFHQVPDDMVGTLVAQLVAAVRYLEDQEIVHRDIKPENIHVSPDFNHLKLLDLGVAREFSLPDEDDSPATDTDRSRPFLATAQYSSPEYLFRLDEPNDRLWHGLNIYQVGAVLHDLIMHRQIFADEMETGNKYLVARAVLLTTPSLDDGDPTRLTDWKALAARCLNKDLDQRLAAVSWDQFEPSLVTDDPLVRLQDALSRKHAASAQPAASADIDFRRNEFARRIFDSVRGAIVSQTGTALPLTMSPVVTSIVESSSNLRFAYDSEYVLCSSIQLRWNVGLYDTSSSVFVAFTLARECQSEFTELTFHRVCAATIDVNEQLTSDTLAMYLSDLLGRTLLLLEVGNPEHLVGSDLVEEAS